MRLASSPLTCGWSTTVVTVLVTMFLIGPFWALLEVCGIFLAKAERWLLLAALLALLFLVDITSIYLLNMRCIRCHSAIMNECMNLARVIPPEKIAIFSRDAAFFHGGYNIFFRWDLDKTDSQLKIEHELHTRHQNEGNNKICVTVHFMLRNWYDTRPNTLNKVSGWG